jgi:hypothetical protein
MIRRSRLIKADDTQVKTQPAKQVKFITEELIRADKNSSNITRCHVSRGVAFHLRVEAQHAGSSAGIVVNRAAGLRWGVQEQEQQQHQQECMGL